MQAKVAENVTTALSEIPPAGPDMLKACSKIVIWAIFKIDQNLKEITQRAYLPIGPPSSAICWPDFMNQSK